MAVSEVGNAYATGEVEILATFGGGDVAASTSLEDVARETANAFGNVFGAELGEFGERHDEYVVGVELSSREAFSQLTTTVLQAQQQQYFFPETFNVFVKKERKLVSMHVSNVENLAGGDGSGRGHPR